MIWSGFGCVSDTEKNTHTQNKWKPMGINKQRNGWNRQLVFLFKKRVDDTQTRPQTSNPEYTIHQQQIRDEIHKQANKQTHANTIQNTHTYKTSFNIIEMTVMCVVQSFVYEEYNWVLCIRLLIIMFCCCPLLCKCALLYKPNIKNHLIYSCWTLFFF